MPRGWQDRLHPEYYKRGNILKKDAFDALRSLYRALGSRLRGLAIVDGQVDWSSTGIYKVERLQGSDESQRTTVHNRFMDRRAEIPGDLVKSMSIAELAVQQNYSQDTAYVSVLNGQCLVLESLFPRIQMRGLRLRLSDDLGATEGTDEEHGGGALPPAKKRKIVAAKSSGAATLAVPSPLPGAAVSKAGGVAATPAHPALAASEDEEGSEEEANAEGEEEE